jgi:hypothetical protein
LNNWFCFLAIGFSSGSTGLRKSETKALNDHISRRKCRLIPVPFLPQKFELGQDALFFEAQPPADSITGLLWADQADTYKHPLDVLRLKLIIKLFYSSLKSKLSLESVA